jgi:hypothetical protein
MRLRWGLLAGLLAGCAGGSAAPDTDTDTDTDATTSFGPTTLDTSSDDESTTGDPAEGSTMIDSQSGDGTSSSGGSSGSTGCPVGELGCPCSDVDPACAKGLECLEDVCAEPLCPDEEHEDNDAFNDAFELGEFDDGDPEQALDSTLSGSADVDWFTYTCTDTLLEDLVPILTSESMMPMRACLFIDCVTGGNPLFECPEGTTPEEAPIGFVPGCCVDDASNIDLSDYNCPDSDNDSVIVHIKAEMGAAEACIGYSMTYTC